LAGPSSRETIFQIAVYSSLDTRMRHILTVALALLVGAAVPLSAQWPKFPTPGPKATDGKVDLRGPTPRTADGGWNCTSSATVPAAIIAAADKV